MVVIESEIELEYNLEKKNNFKDILQFTILGNKAGFIVLFALV